MYYLLSGNILSVIRDKPFPIKIQATASPTVIPAQSNTPVNPVPIFNNLLYSLYFDMSDFRIKEFVFLPVLIVDISDDKLTAA